MLDNRTRNCQAIVGTGASADFIQDNQAMPRGMMQNAGGLLHLDHKRAFAGRDVIFSTNAGKDTIYQPDASTACRHKAADLR